ncbi:MAG: hypothetical protein AVDCRST_MAG93-6437, partial [uncultured Chloroflexia bacterium]
RIYRGLGREKIAMLATCQSQHAVIPEALLW